MRAVAQPVEIALRQHVPPVDRQSPILARLAERVRRNADRCVHAEFILTGPDVRAVAAHHERQVAEQRDAGGLLPRAAPLIARQPLQVLPIENFLGQLRARTLERVRPAAAQRLGPVPPRALVVLRVQRAKQRVVVQPPAFIRDVLVKRPGARRVALTLDTLEPFAAAPQHEFLQRAYLRVLNARRDAHRVETRAQPGLERLLAADLLEVLHLVEGDELRIDRHRAQRGIRRRFAGRHLVDRQQLQDADARRVEPAGDGGDVADFADAPRA